MSPKLFNKIIPTAKVITEPSVLMSTILPANFEFAPIASAIMKLTIAVGQAKITNIIPKSSPLNPSK